MIPRNRKRNLDTLLAQYPAAALLGPRQVGKTALAYELISERDALYLDLESPRDRVKISDIEQFCELNADKLLI